MNKINIEKWQNEIIKSTCELIQIPSVHEESEDISIIAHGISSHAAHPDLGKNAISMALIILTVKIDEIQNVFEKLVDKSENLEVKFDGRKEPLHVSKDNDLVRILSDTFNEVTGNNVEPIAIGGATYARAFENCISFGANMPGDKDMCHQVDEFIEIDNLITSCQIYAEAIYKLAHEI